MANRITAKSNVDTKIVPKVTNEIHREMVKTDILDNVVFKEDVAVLQTSSTTNITCDFSGKDRINLTRTGGNLNISVTNIADGQVVYLLITKTAGQSISFVGVTDITPQTPVINTLATVTYMIIRKGSLYIAMALYNTVIQATESQKGIGEIASALEHQALSSLDKFCVPGYLPTASTSQKGLSQIASSAEHEGLSVTNKVCVPGYLPIADENQTGLSRMATAAQAQGFSLRDRVLTPGNLADVRASAAETAGRVEDKKFVTPSTMKNHESWSALSLQTGWSGNAYYFVDNTGFLHLRLVNVQYNANITGTTLITTIPIWDFASSFEFLIQSRSGENCRINALEVTSTGQVFLRTDFNDYVANWAINYITPPLFAI